MKKILVVCGGPSNEHEVSLRSCRNVVKAMDRSKYKIEIIGISKLGQAVALTLEELQKLTFVPEPTAPLDFVQAARKANCDVCFPLIHGHFGEDGKLQSLLESMKLPYVGSGVDGSVLCMNKRATKVMLKHYGFSVVPWLEARENEVPLSYEDVCTQLNSSVVFVKPSREGSSVGVHKVRNAEQYATALKDAFQYDDVLLIEKAISPGQEIECAILKTPTHLISSIPGEIIASSDFYSYDAKYVSQDAATTTIPARLSSALIEQIQAMAMRAFDYLECRHYARVDFLISEQKEVFLNEVNTIPGFTEISMYPQMIEASGVNYTDLLTSLIEACDVNVSSFGKTD